MAVFSFINLLSVLNHEMKSRMYHKKINYAEDEQMLYN